MNIQSKNEGQKILLVENEPQVQKIFARFLEISGYSVVTASDGLEGLEKIKSDSSIALVITDLNMPHMDGKELLQEARKIKPLLNSIVISGSISGEFVDIPANKIIQKPIGLIDFTRIVKQYI
jgi:CheY-like chemotaxis protein